MTPAPAAPGFRVAGWHVALAMTVFFGVIIAVDGAFLVAAYRTFPGQVSVTPYEDGLAHNRTVARRRAQAALGWQAEAFNQGGSIVVEIKDAAGHGVAGLGLTGVLSRPATEAGAIDLRFEEAAPGRYVAAAAPASGAWDLRFLAQRTRAESFEGERRLTWP